MTTLFDVAIGGTAMDSYERMWEARKRLTQRHSVDTTNELMAQAISYVWGWQDAGGDVRDSEVASDFGYAFGTVVALCELGRLSSRPPIQDAFKSWREHGEIRDFNGRAIDRVSPEREFNDGRTGLFVLGDGVIEG